MPKEESCAGCLIYDEKKMGKKIPSKATLDYWRNKGWLGENGICDFPRDVKAHPSGVITPFPIAWWKNPNEDEYIKAIEDGWIKFVDGNGEEYTLEQYKLKYPDFPNPYYLLRMEGRFPLNPDRYMDLDNKEIQKEAIKWVFRAMM